MKRTKLLQHLQRFGCKLLREGGRHTIYVSVDGIRQTAIPRHAEIKPNTVRKICKDVAVPAPAEK